MQKINRYLIVVTGMLLPALLASPSYAQCGGARAQHISMALHPGIAQLLPAAFAPASDDDWQHAHERPAVVGFWHQQLISEGSKGIPNGAVIDDDLAQWHGDNTEIQNTKSRSPSSSNFCLGVWEQTGPRSFKLNHFPQAFDPTGAIYIGTIQLQEEVTVSPDGKSYKGSFTLDQYDTNGTTVLAHLQGRVKGTRITATSTIADVL